MVKQRNRKYFDKFRVKFCDLNQPKIQNIHNVI